MSSCPPQCSTFSTKDSSRQANARREHKARSRQKDSCDGWSRCVRQRCTSQKLIIMKTWYLCALYYDYVMITSYNSPCALCVFLVFHLSIPLFLFRSLKLLSFIRYTMLSSFFVLLFKPSSNSLHVSCGIIFSDVFEFHIMNGAIEIGLHDR